MTWLGRFANLVKSFWFKMPEAILPMTLITPPDICHPNSDELIVVFASKTVPYPLLVPTAHPRRQKSVMPTTTEAP